MDPGGRERPFELPSLNNMRSKNKAVNYSKEYIPSWPIVDETTTERRLREKKRIGKLLDPYDDFG